MNTIRRNQFVALLMFFAVQMMTGARAIETELSGHMEAQVRWFQSSPFIAGRLKQAEGAIFSVSIKPEWKYLTRDRRHDFKITPFVRYDARDKERTHMDMRELYWVYKGDNFKFLAGVNQVFWGVAESRHLVDIINQTDLVENPDEEEKLGQPMIALTLEMARVLNAEEGRNLGKLTAFLMPGFRERTFPGPRGRLSGLQPVSTSTARFPGGASKDRVDLALRYSHTISKWDLGLHYFHGNSREPWFRQSRAGITPQYDLINQVGADIQYTNGAWLGKFEGIIREGQGKPFGALAAGVEYTFYQPFKTWDVGLLVEYLHDGRDKFLAPQSIFDNDIFLGTRLSFNDEQNTQILAGAVSDLESGAYSFSLEAERRISNSISAELVARIFNGVDGNPVEDILSGIEKDDYVRFSMFYHF